MPPPDMDLKEFLDHHQIASNTYYPINEFFAYCQRTFVGESIEFLMLARTFHPDLGPTPYDFFPANLTSLTERARYLYLEYIRLGAPKQINIPAPCKEKLDISYNNDHWDDESFDQAHKEILGMLETDTWRRFQESDLGRQILAPEGPSFSAVASAAVHNIFLGSQAYNAAKAARANNVQLPAPPPPPHHRRQRALYTAPQQQVQPARALLSAAFLAAQSPAASAPSACSSQGAARAFAAVTVSASAAVAEQASQIRSVLSASAANSPALIITQAKPAKPTPPPVPPLPASVLAKRKPIPAPVPVFPNKPLAASALANKNPVLPANQRPTPLPKDGF